MSHDHVLPRGASLRLHGLQGVDKPVMLLVDHGVSYEGSKGRQLQKARLELSDLARVDDHVPAPERAMGDGRRDVDAPIPMFSHRFGPWS